MNESVNESVRSYLSPPSYCKPAVPPRRAVARCVCCGCVPVKSLSVGFYCPDCQRRANNAATWDADQRALREHAIRRDYMAVWVRDDWRVARETFCERYGFLRPDNWSLLLTQVLARLAEMEQEAMR